MTSPLRRNRSFLILCADQIGGPAIGGLFVAWFGTSDALLGDSVAFAVEAVLLCLLPAALDVTGAGKPKREPWLRGVREGFRVIADDQVLRRQVTAAGALNFGGAVTGGFFVFYTTDKLHLRSWQLGVTFAVFAAVPVQVVGAAVALAGAGTLWMPRGGLGVRGLWRRPGPAVRG